MQFSILARNYSSCQVFIQEDCNIGLINVKVAVSNMGREEEGSKLPSNPKEVEDLRGDTAANPLAPFTFDELKIITGNFRQDYFLGGGGFGSVYKGFITEDLREGLQSLQVAVKVHEGDNSYQGHRMAGNLLYQLNLNIYAYVHVTICLDVATFKEPFGICRLKLY